MFLSVALDGSLLCGIQPITFGQNNVNRLITSVPAPMAIPASALARAGASLIPSPSWLLLPLLLQCLNFDPFLRQGFSNGFVNSQT